MQALETNWNAIKIRFPSNHPLKIIDSKFPASVLKQDISHGGSGKLNLLWYEQSALIIRKVEWVDQNLLIFISSLTDNFTACFVMFPALADNKLIMIDGEKNPETAHCVDSCRYLESCNVPITMKRKCQSSSNTTSSNSDDDKQKGSDSMQVSAGMRHRFISYHQRFTDTSSSYKATAFLSPSHSALWTSLSDSTMPVPCQNLLFSVLFGRTSLVEGSVWSLRFGCSRQKVQWRGHSGSGHFAAPTCT